MSCPFFGNSPYFLLYRFVTAQYPHSYDDFTFIPQISIRLICFCSKILEGFQIVIFRKIRECDLTVSDIVILDQLLAASFGVEYVI